MYVTCAQAFFLALPFMKRMSLPSQNTLYRTFSHNMQEEFLFLVYVWNFANASDNKNSSASTTSSTLICLVVFLTSLRACGVIFKPFTSLNMFSMMNCRNLFLWSVVDSRLYPNRKKFWISPCIIPFKTESKGTNFIAPLKNAFLEI